MTLHAHVQLRPPATVAAVGGSLNQRCAFFGSFSLFGFRPETINALNTHASVIASKYQGGSSRFYLLFGEFIRLFRASGYRENYLEGNPTPVARAYWEYRDAIRTKVTRLAMDT